MKGTDKLTIRDIAEKANVSTATVSRIINKKGGYSAETEKLVMDIVLGNNYTVPEKNSEKVVGILIQDITNSWFAKVAADLEEQLYKNGYAACIYTTGEKISKTKWYFDECMRRRFAGIIVVSPTLEIAEKAKTAKIPVIFIDRTPAQKTDVINVEYDHYTGGYMATDCLIRKGCKNIMFLGMESNNPAIQSRYEGYLDALNDYKIPVSKSLIIELEANSRMYDTAHQRVYYLMKKRLRFDGIFASTDLRALGALHALQQNDVKVPDEVKIVGFDDIPLAKWAAPSLTTIRQDTSEMAIATVKTLMQLLSAPDELKNRHIVLPVSLIDRGTT